MRRLNLLLLSVLFLMRCAAYKELKPKPEINSLTTDFIELKNDKKLFELDKDKKYFVSFPAAMDKNYYLVLDISDKAVINSYLTDTFDDGKGRIIEIKDESNQPLKQSVYAVDNTVQNFYWVIDLVKRDLELEMTYRYVEQWRFRFENRYESFMSTFENNKIDSSGYNALGSPLDLQNYEFPPKISHLEKSIDALNGMHDELAEIETIFPASIVNTKDEAYQNYRALKANLETEMRFQSDYLFVAQLFNYSKTSPPDFVAHVADYQSYYKRQDEFPTTITTQLNQAVASAMQSVASHYSNSLKQKSDSAPIDVPVADLKALAQSAQIIPAQSFNQFAGFVIAFNEKSKQLQNARENFESIQKNVNQHGQMPSNTFFSNIITKLSKLQYRLPKSGSSEYKSYSSYNCVNKQSQEITRLRRDVYSTLEKYRQADSLVPRINALKGQKNYSAMLGMIKQNSNLPFLKSLYKDLDKLSLDTQKQTIKRAFNNQDWAGAESALRKLHRDKNFLNPGTSVPKKNKLAAAYNDSLFKRIERVSLSNARKLMNENITTLTGIEQLYQDAAFLPVYEPAFSTKGEQVAQARNKNLYNKLNQIKQDAFPAKAITQLYSEFTSNPDDNGVLKARAIVAHGAQYKGLDKNIKKRVGECDPWASKWITKAKSYRKLYALPTTTNTGGKNTYVFRTNIRIASKAKFPVYDLNIKLPKEVAKAAATEQWYDKILLNKTIVKNEGRLTVTAPSAENNYEFQITPIRMLANEDNVLEIHFTHKSFKAFQVSVMAQKPIIKKN